MSEIDQKELAKKATEASHQRKRLHVAKVEMMRHMSTYIEQIENLRALTEIIADKNGVDKDLLVSWVAGEIFKV